VWAHAEYLKLCRSLQDGAIFDRPAQTVERYLVGRATSTRAIWSPNNKLRTMPPGSTLRVQTFAPARVHFGIDGWQSVHDGDTCDTTLGVHFLDLPTAALRAGSRVDFTFYWQDEKRWDGTDFCVHVTNT
jgi:glucoamylase